MFGNHRGTLNIFDTFMLQLFIKCFNKFCSHTIPDFFLIFPGRPLRFGNLQRNGYPCTVGVILLGALSHAKPRELLQGELCNKRQWCSGNTYIDGLVQERRNAIANPLCYVFLALTRYKEWTLEVSHKIVDSYVYWWSSTNGAGTSSYIVRTKFRAGIEMLIHERITVIASQTGGLLWKIHDQTSRFGPICD